MLAEAATHEGDAERSAANSAHAQEATKGRCQVGTPSLTAQQRTARARVRCLHGDIGSCLAQHEEATLRHPKESSETDTAAALESQHLIAICDDDSAATPHLHLAKGCIKVAINESEPSASELPPDLARPRAGKLSVLETWQAPVRSTGIQPPFAVDNSVNCASKDNLAVHAGRKGLHAGAREQQACMLQHERTVWAASRLQRPETAHMRRGNVDLRAADAMWFDAASPLMHSIPVRACLGRYKS